MALAHAQPHQVAFISFLCLCLQGFLAVGELDPLNRRLGAQKKPDVVVQVVILAEDNDIRDKLAEHDLHVQTIAEVAPIEVQPARVLSHLYTYLGRNKKLNLSGRKSRDVGILSTSKLYSLKDRIFAFTPQVKYIDYSRIFFAIMVKDSLHLFLLNSFRFFFFFNIYI